MGIIAVCAAALCSCSSGNSEMSSSVDRSGNHPADWVVQHWDAYNNSFGVAKTVGKSVGAAAGSVSSCGECHGGDMLSTKGAGGIARVGCFIASRDGQMCHAGKLGHPIGWRDPPGSLHGRGGAMAAPGVSSGFAYCGKCHGGTFPTAKVTSCMVSACHGNTTSPHPMKPWHGTTVSGTNHVLTDPGNAPECAKCHANGANFGPQIGTPAPAGTAPGCFNNTLCHGFGHLAFASGTFSPAAAHGPPAKAALDSCQSCHATPISPNAGTNPRYYMVIANNAFMASGCETCHKLWTAHPTPWLPGRIGTPNNVANVTSHATAGNLSTACALCHGALLNGVGGNAPSCMSNPVGGIGCHTASPASTPAGTCISCHAASPGGPNGAVWPNRDYGHNKHAQGLGLTCAVCHGNYTSGMASHANLTADMLFSSTYRANPNITITYNNPTGTNGKCSGVSCHGGRTTPAWQNGLINVATDCRECHESGTALGTPQYNSYYSGKHQSHLTGTANSMYRLSNPADIACTDCHKMDKLGSLHFAGLATQVMDTPGDTVGGTAKLTSYDAPNTCLPSCHVSGRRGWFE